MKKILFLIFLFFPIFCSAQAGELEIVPRVIDENVRVKDILKYTVKLKNNTERKLNLYAFVNDITDESGVVTNVSRSDLDRKISITDWTSIKRGVIELMPGEGMELPLEIKVSIYAIPGKYHSVITFAEGSNRQAAQGGVTGNGSKIFVNINVEDNVIERAQLSSFTSQENIFTDFPAIFELNVKNSGNSEIEPRGKVFIYNRREQVVGEVEIAIEKMEANQEKKTLINWNGDGKFGKYKGKLELEYGSKDVRDLQDTIYFWVFPKKIIIIFVVGLFVCTFALTYFLFKKSHKIKYSHHYDAQKQTPIAEIEEKEIVMEDGDGIVDLRKKS